VRKSACVRLLQMNANGSERSIGCGQKGSASRRFEFC
jgi:hypothetical protein